MSTEENKQLILRRVAEIWHNPSLDAALKKVDELVAENYVGHIPGMPDAVGREGFRQLVIMMRTAFPDLRFEADDLFADADRVAARYHGRATHLGPFNGIPATGKSVIITGIDIFRVANGKMAEDWLNFDQLGLLQQLGVVPMPGQASA